MKTQAELQAITVQTQQQMKQWFPDVSVVVIAWNTGVKQSHCALSANAETRSQIVQILREQADAMEREHDTLLVVPRKS